jgi:NAD(P)H dehydrogenase (quinone)
MSLKKFPHVLIIYAHPSPTSKNARLLNLLSEELIHKEFSVTVSDLYQMGFKAVADSSDFLTPPSGSFDLREAQKLAVNSSGFVRDIQEEQRKLLQADVVIFQFPMWFFGMPSILKGWFERVLTKGFAYGEKKEYESGGMSGKKAVILMTTAAPQEDYTLDGKHGEIGNVIYPIQNCMLRYIGFTALTPSIIFGVDSMSTEEFELASRENVCSLVSMLCNLK